MTLVSRELDLVTLMVRNGVDFAIDEGSYQALKHDFEFRPDLELSRWERA